VFSPRASTGSAAVAKYRTQSRFSSNVGVTRSATLLPSGSRTKLGELAMTGKVSSAWKPSPDRGGDTDALPSTVIDGYEPVDLAFDGGRGGRHVVE
jgi:hypothetical protein